MIMILVPVTKTAYGGQDVNVIAIGTKLGKIAEDTAMKRRHVSID